MRFKFEPTVAALESRVCLSHVHEMAAANPFFKNSAPPTAAEVVVQPNYTYNASAHVGKSFTIIHGEKVVTLYHASSMNIHSWKSVKVYIAGPAPKA
jgi:hypothetical protein